MSFVGQNVRILASVLGLILLSPATSQAILCSEYLNTAGQPTAAAEVTELLPDEVRAFTKLRVLVSSKPRIRMNGDQILATFDNLPENEPQIIGIQSNRAYRRPNVHEFTGFMAGVKRDAVSNSTSEVDDIRKLLVKSQTRAMAYGMISAGKPLMVRLRSDEVIAAVTRIDETKRLVATIREERTIGFRSSGMEKGDHYLVELYYFEGTGYSVSGFRVPVTAELPIIKISSQEEKGLLLSVGDRDFHVQFRQLGK